MSRVLLPLLVLVASLQSLVQGQTATYYMCAVLQASTYTSVNQAVLTVNTSPVNTTDYNGAYNNAITATALVSGNRTFTDLTQASPTPVTVQMTSLAPPGSTGGNDNYIFLNTQPQILDGNGLTFNFASNVQVAGQAATGTQMNLWWASGSNSLLEEVAGGTHEAPTPLQSTLTFTTSPAPCVVPSYAQFAMCLQTQGSGYVSSISGLVNTSGTAKAVAPSGSNGLATTLQGWQVTSIANGVRTFANTNTGTTTTSTITGIAPVGSVANNDNLVFPGQLPASNQSIDLNGVGFTLNGAAPLGDGSSTNTVVVKGTPAASFYEQGSGAAQTATVSNLILSVYMPGNQPAPCTASAPQYQFCWRVTSPQFTSTISGVLTVNPFPAGTAAKPYWLLQTVTGSRTYTDLTTGVTTTSQITGLLPTGSIGGNDNRLYIGQTPLFDGDGMSVSWNNVPPIYGQNITGQTMTSNLWYDSSIGNYDEENEGNTHEKNITGSSFTITASSSNSPPACGGSPSTSGAPQGAAVFNLAVTALFFVAAIAILA